jgi:hypothetical protein
MAQERIAERIDANLMDRSLDTLPFLAREAFHKHIERIHKRTSGKLVIKEYATASAHVGHFRHLLNELYLKKQFKPDVLFVDYLNICASSRVKASTGLYELVKSIAEELRGLGVDYDMPVWSATQLNRAGFSASDPDLTNTSESFGLPATADFMFALVNTGDLQNMNQLMVKILKNRYGDLVYRTEAGQVMNKFAIGIDRSKQKLYNLEASAQQNISPEIDFAESVSGNSNVDTLFEIDLPPDQRKFNAADEEAERRRANTKSNTAPYKSPTSPFRNSKQWEKF